MGICSRKVFFTISGFLFLFIWIKIPLISVEVKDLPPRFLSWITKEVVYIITEKEKDVFLRLETDRERDLFIEAFWKQRDPSPDTETNEYREEHYRRFGYANETFGKRMSKPGWKTDMGKTYIILGKPENITTYGSESFNLVPIETWFYQGDYGFGLPSSFYVVFFREEGVGDYIFYSPIRHGPKKLLEAYDGDPAQAINILFKIDRELAGVSLSLIPGETSVYDSRPALSSETLLNKISVLPQKKVNDLYAEKLLRYKSFVEVDHSVYYVPCDAIVTVLKEKEGPSFVHYSIEPKRLSIGSADGKYSLRLEVFGRVSDLVGKTIYQFQKAASLDFSSDEVKEIEAKRFAFQDAFPMIAGNYRFDILVKNGVSKEFTSMESELRIPEPSSSLQLSPLVLSPRVSQVSEAKNFRPFRIGNIQAYPRADRIFMVGGNLFVIFKIYGLTQDLKETGIVDYFLSREDKRVLFKSKNISDYISSEDFCEELSLNNLSPGSFSLNVSVSNSEKRVLLSQKEDFFVSPLISLPREWSLSEKIPAVNDPWHLYVIGLELLNSDKLIEARALLEMAYADKPTSLEYALVLARIYFGLNEFQKAQDILVRFLKRADEQPQIYILLGNSSFFGKDFGKAVYYYKKSLDHFGANQEVLNFLAESLYQAGEEKEALETWKKSLDLYPGQEEIKKKITALDKK